jgi:O-antigen ligase
VTARSSLAVSIQGRFEDGLAFLVPASLALGPAFMITRHGHTAPVLWLEIAISALAAYVLVSRIWLRRPFAPVPVLALLPLLAILILQRRDVDRAVITLFHIALGMIGGWGLACLWLRRSGHTWSAVDSGLVVAGLATTVQVFLAVLPYSPLDYHEHAAISWGISNYIAVVLVIIGLTTWGRMRSCRLPAILLICPLLIFAGAIITLSRVGIVALLGGVGVALLTRVLARRGLRKRDAALFTTVVALAVIAVIAVSIVRTGHHSRFSVEGSFWMRFQLWWVGLQVFLRSPILGTGFGTLRPDALRAVGQPQTFAHNVEVSMLQQAGLFAVPYLAVIALCAYRALRYDRGGGLRLGVLAVLVTSQIEPLFEDTVGGFFSWSVLFAASLGLASPGRVVESMSDPARAASAEPDGSGAGPRPERRPGHARAPDLRQTE